MAPRFKQWALPEAMVEVRNILAGRAGGDRQFVSILSVVSRYGLESVAAACAQVVADKTISSDVILSILSRIHERAAARTTASIGTTTSDLVDPGGGLLPL